MSHPAVSSHPIIYDPTSSSMVGYAEGPSLSVFWCRGHIPRPTQTMRILPGVRFVALISSRFIVQEILGEPRRPTRGPYFTHARERSRTVLVVSCCGKGLWQNKKNLHAPTATQPSRLSHQNTISSTYPPYAFLSLQTGHRRS